MSIASSQVWTKGDYPGVAPPNKIRLYVDAYGNFCMVDDVGTITVLDSTTLSSDIDYLKNIHEDSGEPNGFIRQDPESMGVISFNDASRTFTISPDQSRPEFVFYAGGEKFSKTTSESITIPDVSGTYYIYFDTDGNLQYTSTGSGELFMSYALVAVVYWNADAGYAVIVGDERHGINMDGATHREHHMTVGAVYDIRHKGLDITGLAVAASTYSNISEGLIWDEDIYHYCAASSTHEFWYRTGQNAVWNKTAPDNHIYYTTSTRAMYNEWTGTEWQLTELPVGYYMCVHFFAVPDISVNGAKIVKILGVNKYDSARKAREGIVNEAGMFDLSSAPSPEMVLLYSVVVSYNNQLVGLSGSKLFVDFRFKYGAGKDGHIPWVTSHTDLTDENTMRITRVDDEYKLTLEDRVVIQTQDNSTVWLFNSDDAPKDEYLRTFWILNDSNGYVDVRTDTPDSFNPGNTALRLPPKSPALHLGVIYGAGWFIASPHVAVVQVRRANTWDASNFSSATAVPFDTLDKATSPDVLDYSSSDPTRILSKVNGVLEISYWGSVDSTGGSTYNLTGYLRLNGSQVIDGSVSRTGNYGGEDQTFSIGTLYVDVRENDYLELVLDQDSLTGNVREIVISAKITV